MIYESETIKLSQKVKGIAELVFSGKGSANILNMARMQELDNALNKIKEKKNIKALILSSDKDNFILGADITEFLTVFAKPEQELSLWLEQANAIFTKLEDLPFLTISAVSGYALGGGCECILATDYRIASPNARIGLPETKLGIIPGFGATVRLPRLIGADNAIEMICSGKEQGAEQCLKLGLIDAIVDEKKLRNKALEFAEYALKTDFNWKKRRLDKQSPLKLSLIEAQMIFATSKAVIKQLAGKHYPAPKAALKSIEQGATLSRDQALAIENKHFVKLAKGNVTKALVGIFLYTQQLKSKAKQATKKARPIQSAFVLGAGIMGGGIAYQSASRGIPVLMKDISPKALEIGMQQASKLLNRRLAKGQISGIEMSKIMASITPSLHYAGIEQVDIVVEAVVENPKIKTHVLTEAEQQISAKTILASNTSSIPISELARNLKRPENFCGMHFFNPVHQMPLVEVIQGKKTSQQTIDRVVAYAAKMGKHPIVVKDCPGFFVNRVLFAYFAAFCHLIRDGADFSFIDTVMEKHFGFPMGPAHLLDVIGIDTAHHAQSVMEQSYPDRMSKNEENVLDALFNAKQYGQKTGAGFYQYQSDKKGKTQKVAKNKTKALSDKVASTQRQFSKDEIIKRMLAPLINEVIRCLDEGIIASQAEADMALIYGLGFPAFRGGVCRYLETEGLDNYLNQIEAYENLGLLYQAPISLRKKAEQPLSIT